MCVSVIETTQEGRARSKTVAGQRKFRQRETSEGRSKSVTDLGKPSTTSHRMNSITITTLAIVRGSERLRDSLEFRVRAHRKMRKLRVSNSRRSTCGDSRSWDVRAVCETR